MEERICRMALFSDGTKEYVIPQEPQCNSTVRIRLRTKSCGIKKVVLLHQMEQLEMSLTETEYGYNYYEVSICLTAETFSYLFLIDGDLETLYYDRMGVSNHARWERCFHIVPGFSTPDWAKGAVMYQIFPDRFCNGDLENNTESGEYFYLGKQTLNC